MDKDSIIVVAILIVAVFAVLPSAQTQTIVQFGADDVVVVDNTGDYDSRITSLTVDSGDVAGSFDGTDDYVNCGNRAILDITGSLTLVSWVNVDDLSGFGGTEANFISKDAYDQYRFGLGDSGLLKSTIRVTNGSTLSYCDFGGDPGYCLNEDTWYHIVYMFDSDVGKVEFFVNGVSAGSKTTTNDDYPLTEFNTMPSSSISLLLGKYAPSTEMYFNGDLRDCRVYNRALTSGEVFALYSGTDVTSGLVGHWLDGTDISGTTVHDVSGQGNDGVVVGDTGANFWVSEDDQLPVDFVNAGVTVDDEYVYYSGTLGSEVTYENGIASSGTFVGEMPLIPAGSSATVTIDRCVEGQFEFVPKFAEIVYVDNVSAGDIGMSAYLVDADGTRFDDQPAQVKVSVSDANHVLYQSVQQSSGFLIPAVDAGEYNVDVQFDSWEFGGWSNKKTFSMHVLEDGGIVVNDAGITSGSSGTAGDILDNAQNIIFDLIDSVIGGVMNLITSFGVGN